MSKALIYGFIASIVGIGASATYFFPIVQNINSFLQSESVNSKDKLDNSAEATIQAELNSSSNQSIIAETDPHIENPSVKLNDDTIEKVLKSKSGYNPSENNLLEGEIPKAKTY
jgi:hypothetical protein